MTVQGNTSSHQKFGLLQASRYYPDYDDYSRYDRSPHHHSSRYYDRSPHHYSSSRYYDRDRYDRHSRYDRDYDRRYYDGYSSRHYSSGHRGRNGESLMYRRTAQGDVQVLVSSGLHINCDININIGTLDSATAKSQLETNFGVRLGWIPKASMSSA